MARAVILFLALGALGGCLARAPMYIAQGVARMAMTSQIAARATAHTVQATLPMMARATAQTARVIGHAQPIGCRSAYECGPSAFDQASADTEPTFIDNAPPQPIVYVYVDQRAPDATPAWELPRY